MSASPNRQAVVVGLFVAFGIAILAGGVLTVGDLNDTFTRKVDVVAVFDEVSGLQLGDNVWYSGVKVGTVKSLAFKSQFQVEVGMRIDVEATRFIHRDALAKIGSDGLIGNTIVVLYGGEPKSRTLQDGDVVVTTKSISAEEIMTMVQTNNTNLLAITTDLMEVSENLVMGEGTVGKLLQDDQLYENVNDTVTSLNTAAVNAGELTASLSVFAKKLDPIAEQVAATSSRASTLVDDLAVQAANPKTPIGLLLRDEAMASDVKSTVTNLKEGSLLLNEDLEAVQHNFLLRGFFRRRAKAEAEAEGEAD